jgi:hypothetical protein
MPLCPWICYFIFPLSKNAIHPSRPTPKHINGRSRIDPKAATAPKLAPPHTFRLQQHLPGCQSNQVEPSYHPSQMVSDDENRTWRPLVQRCTRDSSWRPPAQRCAGASIDIERGNNSRRPPAQRCTGASIDFRVISPSPRKIQNQVSAIPPAASDGLRSGGTSLAGPIACTGPTRHSGERILVVDTNT